MQGRFKPKAGHVPQNVRKSCRQGADSSDQRADETVAGEQGRAVLVGNALSKLCLFKRQKDAHVPCRRIEGTDEGDNEQRPEVLHEREGDAGRGHENRGGDEESAAREAVGDDPDAEGEGSRARQRHGRKYADPEGVEAKRRQIGREQQADQTIAERPQSP